MPPLDKTARVRVARFSFAAALCATLCGSVSARADECPPEVASWAARCGERSSLAVTRVGCADSLVTIDVQTAAGPLRLELARGGPRSFRRAGELGISPVGEFPDWDREPDALRAVLDRVSECARAEPGLLHSFDDGGHPAPARPSGFRLLLALGLVAVACFGSLRRARVARGTRPSAIAVPLFAGMAGLVRAVTIPTTFLHQNGQGPLWVGAALDGRKDSWPYGDGYAELFSASTRWVAGSPETGLFALSAALGAASIVCAWILARRASGSRVVAWAAALAVGFDPVLARVSQSESYYGAMTSLLFIAAALLSVGAVPRASWLRVRAPLFGAAGLLVTAAARVHPACWPVLSLLPLALACQPGSRRRALSLVALSAAFVFGIVLSTSASSLLHVARSPLGEHWHGIARADFAKRVLLAAPFALFGVVLVTRRRRSSRALGVIVLAALAAIATNLVAAQTPWIDAAALRLFAPILVPAVGSALSGAAWIRRRARMAVVVVLAVLAVVAARNWPSVARLPTDVLEAEWVRSIRRDVPENARFAYLERVGPRVSHLPLYTLAAAERRVLAVSAHDDAALVQNFRGENLYYRSSLCSTKEGRGVCDRLESQLDLHEIASKELPAIASMRNLEYDEARVRVTLFRATLRAGVGPRERDRQGEGEHER